MLGNDGNLDELLVEMGRRHSGRTGQLGETMISD